MFLNKFKYIEIPYLDKDISNDSEFIGRLHDNIDATYVYRNTI